jgi:hypothetical protein
MFPEQRFEERGARPSDSGGGHRPGFAQELAEQWLGIPVGVAEVVGEIPGVGETVSQVSSQKLVPAETFFLVILRSRPREVFHGVPIS